MRAPAPEDTVFTSLTPAQVEAGDFHGALWNLHDLAGTQFSWLAPATQPMTVQLISAVDRVNFDDATVEAQGSLRAVRATTAATTITLMDRRAQPVARCQLHLDRRSRGLAPC